MRKTDEVSHPQSCLSRARTFEMIFVLLGRDVSAPVAIRAWAADRVRIGKNKDTDGQIIEAIACATAMELEQHEYHAPTCDCAKCVDPRWG